MINVLRYRPGEFKAATVTGGIRASDAVSVRKCATPVRRRRGFVNYIRTLCVRQYRTLPLLLPGMRYARYRFNVLKLVPAPRGPVYDKNNNKKKRRTSRIGRAVFVFTVYGYDAK